ncbi:MAG: DUF4446 family protein [Kyrpidia sp.]|nr:DUF4446 family protein [Kyrpidia sp.]
MFSSIAAVPLWYWVAAIGVLVVLLWVVVAAQSVRLGRTQRRYRQWVSRSGTDLEKFLPETLEQLQNLSKELRDMEDRLEQLEQRLSATLRTVRVVRYNAFADVGSDLSFSAAWLDGQGNGIILSSIYGRDESRMYAKPVEGGISPYPLSEEEKRVLRDALNAAGAPEPTAPHSVRHVKERL